MYSSLKVKILTLITVILVVIFSTAAYLNYQKQKEMLQEIANRNTAVLIETIRSSIGNAMLSGRSDEIANIFARIKSREFVKSIRIIDTNGRVLNSAVKEEIGKMVPDLDERAIPRNYNFFSHDGVFESYARIGNAPQCYKCHSPSKDTLGLLEIRLSLDYMTGFLEGERETAIIACLLLTLLVSGIIALFLTGYVERPIRRLISYMKEVENGRFDQQIALKGSIEMSTLGESFNLMVGRLKGLIDSTCAQERELARAQENLKHHQETDAMNARLEEQIREIENLNVSLEERIEEIEEANYKIADLAGELEDKNTNLEKAVTKLSTLYRLGLAINGTMEIDSLLNLVVKTTIDTMQAQIGYVVLYDAERGSLSVTNIMGNDRPIPNGTRIPMKRSSVSTWVIENRKPLLIADIEASPHFDRISALGFETKSAICVPLMVKEEIIGTITVINKVNNTKYNHEELELLSTIAAQASIAIKNAKLYDEQQKTYLNTIQALVSAIEANDSYTRGHSERVTRYSLAIARKLELPQERLEVIERAAILHDIGKIGINMALLNKKDELTPEEVAELRQHPSIGMKILEPIEFLHDVRLCIGQHHERFDAQGYPGRLGGDRLLLESRILAIADAFDAMTSERPYRKPLGLADAIQELRDHAGAQFDPGLVPIFITILKDPDFVADLPRPAAPAEPVVPVAPQDCAPGRFVV
ncbi:HD domain-containing phosphohydrolase [Geomesophilobacter sediminis]|uniref:GAF domain-containing protein n=1 Tax=Geomesophilobacter sediminis TaxID=2798584 RepID=A0A8J7IW28_9BACT|nr:HD domain-containing phosphohydrolase [Geomesophilobacter sediminis]MBJ6723557.1 GAF domain-containing protein [Geomesophilobacter sediminis]